MKSDDFRPMTIRESRKLASEARKVLKYRGSRLDGREARACADDLMELQKAIGRHKSSPDESTVAGVSAAAGKLLGRLKSHEAVLKNASSREYVEAILVALVVAMLFRIFLFEAFQIPTGSMIPTVAIKNQMFVNKAIYGLRVPFTHFDLVDGAVPERGDVVVFDYPVPGRDFGKAFLKRVIGVPGDRVRLEGNRLIINGKPIPTEVVKHDGNCADDNLAGCVCERQKETLGDVTYITQHISGAGRAPSHACRNDPEWPVNNPMSFASPAAGNEAFPDVIVPEGHVLCMGDNRDNSSDGRYWGFVPIENLRGKAVIFWWPPKKMFKLVK